MGVCAPRSATKSDSPHRPTDRGKDAELTDLRLELGDLSEALNTRDSSLRSSVDRRVLEDERAGRHLDIGSDQFDHAAASQSSIFSRAGRCSTSANWLAAKKSCVLL